MPLIKKICIVTKSLNEDEKTAMSKRLNITKQEIEQIQKDGFWYPDISKYGRILDKITLKSSIINKMIVEFLFNFSENDFMD